MWLVFGLLVVAYLPGAMIFRIPAGSRETRAALAWEERVFWAVVISVCWSSAAALALAVAGSYTIERLLAANLLLVVAIGLTWRQRLLMGSAAARPSWSLLLPSALVVAGVLLFSPPSEYIIGGKDPGVYVNEGIAIAQRGSLLIHDPVVASVPAASRDLFFPSYGRSEYFSVRFMGLFVLDPAAGTVVGQFPHLYPVSVAIGYGLAGLTGARQAVVWWSVLGLLALYFAGARLCGRLAAAAAAALLAVSVVQIWFARYPNSEMEMQALLFAALLAWARAQIDGDRFFAPIAGVMLGLLLCLRIDGALAIVAVAAASLLLATQQSALPIRFLGPLVVTSAAAWVYLTRVMTPYVARPVGFLANLQWPHLLLLGSGAAALVTLLLVARRPSHAAAIRRWAPRLLAALVVLAATYAYFFRHAGGRLAAADADAFRTFGWYLPPAALAAAVIGFALVIWYRFWRDPALLATVTVFSFFFFYKTQIVPEHFWMARRFVPVIMPASLLMIAALATAPRWLPGMARLARRRVHLIWQVAMALVLLGLVGWRLGAASRPIARHVEYAGVIPKLEALAAQFGDRDLVIVEPRSSSDMHVLALPLSYIYGRNVLVLNTPRPDRPRFREFLEWAWTKYEAVYFVGGGGVDVLSRSLAAEAVASERFQIPEYEPRLNAYPTGVRQKEFDFGVYRFVPGKAASPFRALDVGTADDLYVRRFHAKQVMDGVTYRWTKDASYVALPALTADIRLLTLWMNDGGRPATAGPVQVSIAIDDRPIGTATVTRGFRPYTFAIPPELAAELAARDDPAVVRISSSTWNPRVALGSADDRDLGVMLDRVEVQ